MLTQDVIRELSRPFGEDDVKFRKQGTAWLAYIDARSIITRLNTVVGAENWSDTYKPLQVQHTVQIPVYGEADDSGTFFQQKTRGYDAYKKSPSDKIVPATKNDTVFYSGILCELTILGITKSDLGTPSPAEEEKGMLSDSLKRAAVRFGIGAYLYELKGLPQNATYDDLPEEYTAEYLTPDDHTAILYHTLPEDKKVLANEIFAKYNYVVTPKKPTIKELYKEIKWLV